MLDAILQRVNSEFELKTFFTCKVSYTLTKNCKNKINTVAAHREKKSHTMYKTQIKHNDSSHENGKYHRVKEAKC